MVTTVSRKGQTVVPADIRLRFHIASNTKLDWISDGETIRVIPLPADPIGNARGIAEGSGLSQALREDRRRERNRG